MSALVPAAPPSNFAASLVAPAAAAPLHLVRMTLEEGAVFAYAAARGLTKQGLDDGYVAHAVLCALFGVPRVAHAPLRSAVVRPFAVTPPRGRRADEAAVRRGGAGLLTLLGYCRHDAAALADHVALYCQDPLAIRTVDWATFASKPMPTVWTAGTRLAFEARVSAVRRLATGRDGYARGAEIEIFAHARQFAAARGAPVPATREEAYRLWLTEVLAERGAALAEMALDRFAMTSTHRPRHDAAQTFAVRARPDGRVVGELVVVDPAAFPRLLATGIGRSRVFGRGMVLLAPPRAAYDDEADDVAAEDDPLLVVPTAAADLR